MSRLEGLELIGIRSFSASVPQKIAFMTPLTLIMGQNGAGKTTIIEALRTVTSGEMPPNTNKGKLFVHDPRLSGLAETKAFIKLKFTSRTGAKVFAGRSFQLTNKKEVAGGECKQTFSTRENAIKITQEDKNDPTKVDEKSISGKCADMQGTFRRLMGVSKAVLENVIFCHQDEALWPFSDQVNLKKIFDEIFETAKISKILTELRQSQKKYKQAVDKH